MLLVYLMAIMIKMLAILRKCQHRFSRKLRHCLKLLASDKPLDTQADRMEAGLSHTSFPTTKNSHPSGQHAHKPAANAAVVKTRIDDFAVPAIITTANKLPNVHKRADSIQMAPIISSSLLPSSNNAPAKPPTAKSTTIQATTLMASDKTVCCSTEQVRRTICKILETKHGIDTKQLQVIYQAYKEHKRNELEGPLLVGPFI